MADERVHALLPSLLLNVGDSLLANGHAEAAPRSAERVKHALGMLPDDGYREFVARAIDRLLDRIHVASAAGQR